MARQRETMMEKRCTRCGLVKPITEFYKAKGNAYQSRCKECQKQISRENWSQMTTEDKQITAAKWRIRYHSDPRFRMRERLKKNRWYYKNKNATILLQERSAGNLQRDEQ